jgi:hypothetical protein
MSKFSSPIVAENKKHYDFFAPNQTSDTGKKGAKFIDFLSNKSDSSEKYSQDDFKPKNKEKTLYSSEHKNEQLNNKSEEESKSQNIKSQKEGVLDKEGASDNDEALNENSYSSMDICSHDSKERVDSNFKSFGDQEASSNQEELQKNKNYRLLDEDENVSLDLMSKFAQAGRTIQKDYSKQDQDDQEDDLSNDNIDYQEKIAVGTYANEYYKIDSQGQVPESEEPGKKQDIQSVLYINKARDLLDDSDDNLVDNLAKEINPNKNLDTDKKIDIEIDKTDQELMSAEIETSTKTSTKASQEIIKSPKVNNPDDKLEIINQKATNVSSEEHNIDTNKDIDTRDEQQHGYRDIYGYQEEGQEVSISTQDNTKINQFATLYSKEDLKSGTFKMGLGDEEFTAVNPKIEIQKIALNISDSFKAGEKKISVSLYPEQLGKVDIEIKSINNSITQIRIVTHNKDSYELVASEIGVLGNAIKEIATEGTKLNLELNDGSQQQDNLQNQSNNGENSSGQNQHQQFIINNKGEFSLFDSATEVDSLPKSEPNTVADEGALDITSQLNVVI